MDGDTAKVKAIRHHTVLEKFKEQGSEVQLLASSASSVTRLSCGVDASF